MKKQSKKIAKKVKPFSSLSKPEKRVAIAKDVLQQIKIGKYIAETGSYIGGIKFIGGEYISDMENEDIQKNFKKIRKCEVCAMGACLMSVTKFANKLEFGDIGSSITELNNDKVKRLFASIFSPSQLLMIERAFEGDSGGTTVGCDVFDLDEYDFEKQIEKCDEFYKSYFEQEERLVAIMKNIIKNKGTFKP